MTGWQADNTKIGIEINEEHKLTLVPRCILRVGNNY